jgi:hypothetical protein
VEASLEMLPLTSSCVEGARGVMFLSCAGAERRARKTEALKAKAFRCSEVDLRGRGRNPTVL